MTTRLRWSLLGAAAMAGTFLVLPAAAQEECNACHEDQAKAFAKTDHGRRFLADGKHKDASCISCHTGTKEHVESSGEKKPASIRKGAEANVACLACHADNPKHANWPGSPHQMAGVACASCHNPHTQSAAKPKTAQAPPGPSEGTKKCLECHGGLRAALHQRSAHPMNEGKMVIDVHIARLRKKIDQDQTPPLIHTVRGVGFIVHEREA